MKCNIKMFLLNGIKSINGESNAVAICEGSTKNIPQKFYFMLDTTVVITT